MTLVKNWMRVLLIVKIFLYTWKHTWAIKLGYI